MPMMIKTVTGIFSSADAALRAGERAREVGGSRATIRVLVPGATPGKIIETSVLNDNSSYWQIPIGSVVVGILLAALLAFYREPLSYLLVALFASVAMGAMMAFWLTGELYPRRIFLSGETSHERYLQTVLSGRSVVTAVVRGSGHAASVASAFTEAGGDVTQGFLHQQSMTTPPPLATTA